eukprot:TRINITY_DN76099_c0_g1_i1.p1 TRINITY_DN76099_c0_g1~~TRINITY_DN76099_c0_g1_i1.p1  ORF type:complete len:444 (-),score=124.24 TRINITY_DN76099_c0_g1_i1:347-1642(-)
MTCGVVAASPVPHRFGSEGGKPLLTVDLPSLESLQGVDLDISGSEVCLQLPGCDERLCIPLPKELAAEPEAAAAKFSRKRRQLTIAWELSSVTSADEAVASEGEVPEIQGETEIAWREINAEGENPAESLSGERIECLELLVEEVEHCLKHCTVKKLRGLADLRGGSIVLDDFDVEGEATAKGGECCFKVSVSLTWMAMDPFGGQLGACGTVSVAELTHNDTLATVQVKTSAGGSTQARAASDWMKRKGASLVAECLNGTLLSAAVSAAAPEPRAAPSGKQQEDRRLPKPQVEKRCMAEWAKEALASKLSSLSVKLFGGLVSARLNSPQVLGTTSISASAGEVAAEFLLSVDCTWVCKQGDKEVNGSLKISDFSSQRSAKDCTIDVEAAPGQKSPGQFLAAFKQSGIAAVRLALAQFASELRLEAERATSE